LSNKRLLNFTYNRRKYACNLDTLQPLGGVFASFLFSPTFSVFFRQENLTPHSVSSLVLASTTSSATDISCMILLTFLGRFLHYLLDLIDFFWSFALFAWLLSSCFYGWFLWQYPLRLQQVVLTILPIHAYSKFDS
jgi:hypothetical protein